MKLPAQSASVAMAFLALCCTPPANAACKRRRVDHHIHVKNVFRLVLPGQWCALLLGDVHRKQCVLPGSLRQPARSCDGLRCDAEEHDMP